MLVNFHHPPDREVRRVFKDLKFKQILIWKKLLHY